MSEQLTDEDIRLRLAKLAEQDIGELRGYAKAISNVLAILREKYEPDGPLSSSWCSDVIHDAKNVMAQIEALLKEDR